jgi:hypothetical protein
MAVLNGVMAADFSDFMFEVDKSVVKLKELEGASGQTNNAIGGFAEGLGAVDKTLGLFGIRIGPQIQALRELGNVANLTFDKLGLLGSAGAIAATAVGSYKITEAVMAWTGLNEIIGQTIATAMGWDDVTQRTGARLDVLSRATQIAGREITDFDQAMQVIKKHNLEVAESFNTGSARVEQWNRELAKVAKDMPTIQAELKNHTSTVQQLAQHYGISTQALEYYNRTLAESTKAQKTWADEARPKYEAIAEAQRSLTEAAGGWHQTLLTITPANTAAATTALAYGNSQKEVALALNLSAAQVAAVDRQMQLNLATMAATEPALGSLDQWIKTNYADTKAWNNEWRFTSEVIGEQVAPALADVPSKIEGVSSAMSSMTAMVPGMTQKSPGASIPINLGEGLSIPNFDYAFDLYSKTHGGASGVGMIGGGPAPDFLSWAMSHGYTQQAPQVNNTFNIVDTESGIARRVGDTITSQVQRGSLVN